MSTQADPEAVNVQVAHRWCESKGDGWSLFEQVGRGGTAPVFKVQSPEGERALKIYDTKYSKGQKGRIEEKRIEQQVKLGVHKCPHLIQTFEGGRFEDRLFILMNCAPGSELLKQLSKVPREKIRSIVGQIASACIFLRNNKLCHRDIKSENIFISTDYEIATLLDVSVVRDIYDPIGLGTDHDGQLPVVATARYSPPEYLFRLLEPGPQLWHAVDIYQLGGLLHDLIMRRPLFDKEFIASSENRYQFAWVVATTVPEVSAADVDKDLVLTANRALDKNWERRSLLQLEDFLGDSHTQQARALSAIGLSGRQASSSHQTDVVRRLRRVMKVAEALESKAAAFLREGGATARHSMHPGENDYSKQLSFVWDNAQQTFSSSTNKFELRISLQYQEALNGWVFQCTSELKTCLDAENIQSTIAFPHVEDGENTVDRLTEHIEASLGKLASDLVGQPTERT